MANPFDDIIKDAHPNKHEVQTTISGEAKKAEGNKSYIPQPTRKSKRMMVERAVYFILIIGLITLILVNPFCKKCSGSADDAVCQEEVNNKVLTGATVLKEAENSAPPTVEEKAVNNETATQITITSNANTTNTTPAQPANQSAQNIAPATTATKPKEKAFDINFDFSIDNVDYVKDAAESNKPVKMKSITFTMRNRWKSFEPRLDIVWYDKASSDIFKQKIRTSVPLRINEGEAQTLTVNTFDSTFFDPTNRAETVELRLYDSKTNILLTTETQVIS